MGDIDLDLLFNTLEAVAFDPLTQTFDLTNRFGQPGIVALDQVDEITQSAIVQCIIQASQIGAAIAVLILLLILTKPEKRRLPVFSLNSLALLFTIVGQVLACLYYTSSWYTQYARITSDYSFVTHSAKAVSIATPIFFLLVVTTLETSLVLQVHVVCVTLDKWKRIVVAVASLLVALLAIALRLAQTVDNIIWNTIRVEFNYASKLLVQARDISLAVSICFFSGVFCAKLGWSLLQRRRMGLTQFGPMQIILIGGCQTLIIPAIFAVVQFLAPTTRINSMILTIAVLSLPLTSLWASAASVSGSSGNDAAARPVHNDRDRLFTDITTSASTPTSSRASGKAKRLLSALSLGSFGRGHSQDNSHNHSVSEKSWVPNAFRHGGGGGADDRHPSSPGTALDGCSGPQIQPQDGFSGSVAAEAGTSNGGARVLDLEMQVLGK